MEHLFANFGGKPIPSTPGVPTLKKRQISPGPISNEVDASKTIAEGGESAKKVRIESDKEIPVVTDEFETEAKRTVEGNVGLGGGEAEGLILSHAVSSIQSNSSNLESHFNFLGSTSSSSSTTLPLYSYFLSCPTC